MSAVFSRRYGPWALVAGASEGLGAAFAHDLAGRGLNLMLVARRQAPLEALAGELRRLYGIETRALSLDLGDSSRLEGLLREAEGLDLGMVVVNAAYAPIGRFLELDQDKHRQVIAVNVQAAAALAHGLGRMLVRRGRGGLILMSSLSGLQGTALVAHYAATKAYLMVLAEGLWAELSPLGVDVLGCVAGATATPAYLASLPARAGWFVPQAMAAEEVVREAMEALGRGPICIPGWSNRLAALLVQRVLPRRMAVELISLATRRMYGR